MKHGVAAVFGALGMFVSGYILGFTIAVPDVMRAASWNSEGNASDATMTFDADSVPLTGADVHDPVLVASDSEMEAMRLQEIQKLKKMIVPLLTDDEIKKKREEASKPEPVAEVPTGADSATTPAPNDAPLTMP